MLRVARWGNKAVNSFFRLIYSGALWLPRAVAAEAVHHGWIVTALCLHLLCLDSPVFLRCCAGFVSGGLRRTGAHGAAAVMEVVVYQAKNAHVVPCDVARLHSLVHQWFQYTCHITIVLNAQSGYAALATEYGLPFHS